MLFLHHQMGILLNLGEINETKEITPSEMTERLDKLTGFFHIPFVKENGDAHNMYCHVRKRMTGSTLEMQDLQQKNKEKDNVKLIVFIH